MPGNCISCKDRLRHGGAVAMGNTRGQFGAAVLKTSSLSDVGHAVKQTWLTSREPGAWLCTESTRKTEQQACRFDALQTHSNIGQGLRSNKQTRLFCGCHAPHRIANVVGHEQRSTPVHGNPNGPSQGLPVPTQKTRQHIFRFSGGFAVPKGNESHLVAARRIAVPGCVLADEGAIPVADGKQVGGVDRQPEGCRMRPSA